MEKRIVRPIVSVALLSATLFSLQPSFTLAAEPAAAPGTGASAKDCDHYIKVMSGGAKDDKLMEKAVFKGIAEKLPDLLTCGAVKADSDALCKLIEGEQAIKSCRATRSTFHELKANPNGRGFMFNDVQFEDCKNFPALKPHCDAFRQAARSGDASKCSALGQFESNCKAALTLDKSLCTAPTGKDFEGKDKNNPTTWGEDVANSCKSNIDRLAPFAKGLKAVAESGSDANKALAKAALGDADACSSYAEAAQAVCKSTLEPPKEEAAAPEAPAAKGPASAPTPSKK